tara:strand:+ start:316 stop:840 length:525 start_codon:yes stop_codon:yes gene_type:complete
MRKYLIAILLLEVCLGQMDFVNSFLNANDLVLSNGQKIEKIKVGKNITIGYQDSVEREVVGKIKAVTDKEIKIKENDNGQIFTIRLGSIRFIEQEFKDRRGCYNGAYMGGIFTGGIVALVGDWSTPSDAFAGLIITPIMAGFGASIGALIGSLSDSVITKKYIIDDDNWKIVAG